MVSVLIDRAVADAASSAAAAAATLACGCVLSASALVPHRPTSSRYWIRIISITERHVATECNVDCAVARTGNVNVVVTSRVRFDGRSTAYQRSLKSR